MLLTDFCNRLTTRAPVDRPIPEREVFTIANRRPATLRPTEVDLSTFVPSAPSHLAAARSRVDARLTARIELWPRSHSAVLISELRRAPRPGRAPTAAVFSAAGRVDSEHL